jgi:hypothetical protein
VLQQKIVEDLDEHYLRILVDHTDFLRRDGFLDEETHGMFIDFIEQGRDPFKEEPILRLIVRRYFLQYRVMHEYSKQNGYIQHMLIDNDTIDRIWVEEYQRQAKHQLWMNKSLLNEIAMVQVSEKPKRKNYGQERGFREILKWAKEEIIEDYMKNYGYCYMGRLEAHIKDRRKNEIKNEVNPDILTGKKMAISHLNKAIENLKRHSVKDRYFKDISLKEFIELKKQNELKIDKEKLIEILEESE